MGYMPPRKAFAIGIMHAMRALEVDNTRAETHALLGQFNKTMEYNWPEVHREMALALRLDPSSPVVRTRYAVSELMPQGHLAEASAELERALQFDPLAAGTSNTYNIDPAVPKLDSAVVASAGHPYLTRMIVAPRRVAVPVRSP
jgi:hypothetical protein